MEYTQAIKALESLADPENVKGMARYGISTEGTLGVPMPEIKKLAKKAGRNHALALRLWDSGIHEARILASLVDDPAAVTEQQADAWVHDFDSWDVCDQVCMNLLWLTPFAYDKCYEWAGGDEVWVKRAAFSLMARLAWRDKDATNQRIAGFLPVIKNAATDERNFVKKAVNWALRQVGKRNRALNTMAIETAREIRALDSKSARWIANDALRELEGDAVQRRLAAG